MRTFCILASAASAALCLFSSCETAAWAALFELCRGTGLGVRDGLAAAAGVLVDVSRTVWPPVWVSGFEQSDPIVTWREVSQLEAGIPQDDSKVVSNAGHAYGAVHTSAF